MNSRKKGAQTRTASPFINNRPRNVPIRNKKPDFHKQPNVIAQTEDDADEVTTDSYHNSDTERVSPLTSDEDSEIETLRHDNSTSPMRSHLITTDFNNGEGKRTSTNRASLLSSFDVGSDGLSVSRAATGASRCPRASTPVSNDSIPMVELDLSAVPRTEENCFSALKTVGSQDTARSISNDHKTTRKRIKHSQGIPCCPIEDLRFDPLPTTMFVLNPNKRKRKKR